MVHTSVPLGGGLSSSAALEVATHTFLEALEGSKVTVKGFLTVSTASGQSNPDLFCIGFSPNGLFFVRSPRGHTKPSYPSRIIN